MWNQGFIWKSALSVESQIFRAFRCVGPIHMTTSFAHDNVGAARIKRMCSQSPLRSFPSRDDVMAIAVSSQWLVFEHCYLLLHAV